MINLCTFLNTRIENSGSLAWLGDKALTPVRYLFDGRTFRIDLKDQTIAIHRVASFAKVGDLNSSRTNSELKSSSTGLVRTALAIVLIVPGFIIGIAFKGVSYLFTDVRRKHVLVRNDITPCVRSIGKRENPIKSEDELAKALTVELSNSRPTDGLIIYGDGYLRIENENGILHDFNPMKLILEGAEIVPKSEDGCLFNEMDTSRKWQIRPGNEVDFRLPSYSRHLTIHPINSTKQALEVTAPNRSFFKKYHMVFSCPRPDDVEDKKTD
jgi:hypothetical protein